MSEQPHSPELTALEQELRRLSPREPFLDRDALMLRLGRASAPSGHIWKWTTIGLALSSLTLGVLLYQRPVRVVERPIYVYGLQQPQTLEPPVVPDPAPVSPESDYPERLAAYHRLQEAILKDGLDAMGPPPQPEPEPTKDLQTLYQELMP